MRSAFSVPAKAWVKVGGTEIWRLVLRERPCSTFHRVPWTGTSESPASRNNARVSYRRLAVDEFGATFRRVSELLGRKREKCARRIGLALPQGHLPARAPQLAGGHWPAAPAPMTMISECRVSMAQSAIRVPDPVAEPISRRLPMADCFPAPSLPQGGVDRPLPPWNRRRLARPSRHQRPDRGTRLNSSTKPARRKEPLVPPLLRQLLHAEFTIEYLQREGEVDLGLSSKDVGYPSPRRPAKCASDTVSKATTTIGSPPISARPHAILPWASRTTP